MPNTNGAVDLGAVGDKPLTAEEYEAIRRIAADAEGGKEPTSVITAFTVILTRQGEVFAGEYEGDDLALDMSPSPDLIYGMAATVQKDVAAVDGAKQAVHLQMQQARAMSEQIQQAQIAQQLGPNLRTGGPRG